MAKRRRPTKLKTDKREFAVARRRWRSWIPQMNAELCHLLGSQDMFWELQDIAKSNKEILKPYAFFDWICRNYVHNTAMGVRSFSDRSSDVHSLWRILFEILERPGVISRASHVALYRNIPIGPGMGHRTFDRVAGKGKDSLSQLIVRQDIRRLEDDCERVTRLVNKRIAHRTSRGSIKRLPIFKELDQALETLDELFCKYNLLITGAGMTTARATRQYDWQRVLTFPWKMSQKAGVRDD